MNALAIPEPIANAVAGMLAPYRPGLTPQKLEEALDFPEKTPPPEHLKSRKEALTELRISMPSLDRMLASGELNKVKIRGRVFIRESEIRSIIEGTTTQTAAGGVGSESTGGLVESELNGGATCA